MLNETTFMRKTLEILVPLFLTAMKFKAMYDSFAMLANTGLEISLLEWGASLHWAIADPIFRKTSCGDLLMRQ